MKTVLVVTFMLALPISALGQRDGNTMLHDCNLDVSQDGGKKLEGIESLDAMACVSYVAGYLDAVYFFSDLGKDLACFPAERVSTMQAERIFVKYLVAHPEQLHKSAEFLLARSLQEAFRARRKTRQTE
jgi:Ssp1 endopeptidase immunity protein Rap1a